LVAFFQVLFRLVCPFAELCVHQFTCDFGNGKSFLSLVYRM
jgi:hypothetical protein